ncbi:TonB-dependent receptor domain-containing protein [Oceanospirillum linum]|uniref:TonB-dependent receptor n=1 Tax=Oceanospirillum linum TaxID=966 RepID=A0A1T1HDD8_OCELI|nr:TonB-dependent receptor [Oceanospirillum linum]OOV87836.1 hypothetical protein BTA35_0207495 [Oceanospirillum linum]SEG10732.1 vitamin B12 transporter [Oleiphilus messinensis]SMP08946.1 vitamin B12 transporter [Oceanospirillum linum]
MKKIILATAVSAALSPVAFAADPMTIVITASRTEQAQTDTVSSVTVITKEDLKQQQPKSVTEALAATPGIQIRSNGGYGQESSLFLRGISQDRMLVLVDGVQIGSATLGEVSLHHLPVDQIERIEVVRGARSSLYGANAIGGVIQIFTKQQKQEHSHAEIALSGGSNNTQQGAISISHSDGQSQLRANISHFTTDGFDIKPDQADLGADDDGYTNSSVKLDAEHKVGKHTFLAGMQYTTGENDYDRAYLGYDADQGKSIYTNDAVNEFVYSSFYAGIESALSDNLTLNAKASHYKDDNQTVLAGEDQNSFITNTEKLELQATRYFDNELLLVAGFDYKKDDVSDSTQSYDEETRDNKALFALLEKSGEKYQAALSARIDDNEAFGSFSTYGIDANYQVAPKVKITAGFATAFLVPTFNDMYWPNQGNPDLDPETSDTATLGLNFQPESHLSFDINLYQTQLDDMIAWAPDADGNWKPSNVDSVRITGAELIASADLGNTQLTFNANLLDTEDKQEKKQLIYRAKQTANLRVNHTLNQLTLGFDAQFTGERYTDAQNTDKLGGFTLYNLDARYLFSPQLDLSASIKNLTDKDYVSTKGYATAGRTVFGTFRYRF